MALVGIEVKGTTIRESLISQQKQDFMPHQTITLTVLSNMILLDK